MIHGYARCSTNESKQDIDRQVRELKQAGAENIFLEYEHGDSRCEVSVILSFGTGAGGRYDHHIGGFQTRQKHQTVVRDY